MRLVIYVDFVCARCFVAKRRLDHALDRLGQPPVHIRWRPFRQYPDIPTGGLDEVSQTQTRLTTAAGDVQALTRTALELGIELDLEVLRFLPNTVLAHALAAFAAPTGLQYELVDALFSAYFEHARDLGRPEVLADIAGEVGLDWSDTSRALESEGLRREIRTQAAAAREAGIHAVPTFVLNGKTALVDPPSVETLSDFLSTGLLPESGPGQSRGRISIH